ncbi:hypothetical protein VitviT2T_028135 [Vitis vinifera]|uniref:Secreted protein n=1 Tax=Vitis vinifera TaxID=29760 RepID=A0ABY9DS97_VITVI|nr:hypothetical protein VitviT2T_028135 [Vitis vinifera]
MLLNLMNDSSMLVLLSMYVGHLCVVVSVLNKCTMVQNSVAEMVMEAFNVEGVAGGIGGVVGGSVEVASSIGGAVAGGTDYVGSSSYCVCSACGGTGGAGLGRALRGAEYPANCVHLSRVNHSRQW